MTDLYKMRKELDKALFGDAVDLKKVNELKKQVYEKRVDAYDHISKTLENDKSK